VEVADDRVLMRRPRVLFPPVTPAYSVTKASRVLHLGVIIKAHIAAEAEWNAVANGVSSKVSAESCTVYVSAAHARLILFNPTSLLASVRLVSYHCSLCSRHSYRHRRPYPDMMARNNPSRLALFTISFDVLVPRADSALLSPKSRILRLS